MFRPILIAAALAVALAVASGAAGAQPTSPPILFQPDPDSPIGTRNANAPAAMADFDVLMGDWEVEIDYTPPGGQTFTYQARWHNHWILDGMAVVQEWRGPYATGAEIRYFNAETDRIEGFNLYPGNGNAAQPTRSVWENGRLEVTAESVDAQGPLLNRETYLDITGTSFRMYAEQSRDGGETWSAGTYEMVATRAPEQARSRR